MVEFDQAEWRRKHDGPGPAIVPRPERHFYPGTLSDLLEIIRMAQQLPQSSARLRASGSHWALSEAALTHSWIIETNALDETKPRLNATLYDVIPRCLSDGARAALINQRPDQPQDHYNYYHVEAGVRIYELYSRLDGKGDQRNSDPTHGEMPTTRAGLANDAPALSGRWALPTLGGAGGQTIVGAFSTGTHGADQRLPPICDAVAALHLVAADGNQYWIEPDPNEGRDSPTHGFSGPRLPNLTEDDRLRAVYPGILIVRNSSVFRAVLVSVGRFGIIYSVVLRVVRQFMLLENRYQRFWSDIRPRLLDRNDSLFQNNRALQIVVSPHELTPSTRTCFITTRNEVPITSRNTPLASSVGHAIPPDPGHVPRLDDGSWERAGENAGRAAPLGTWEFNTFLCSRRNASEAVREWLRIIRMLETTAYVFLGPFGPAVTRELIHQRWALEPYEYREDISLGEVIVDIANQAVARRDFAYVHHVNDYLLNRQQERRDARAISFSIMDGADYLDTNCVTSAESAEFMFDADRSDYLAFIDQVFARIGELEAGTLLDPGRGPISEPGTFGGYISLRFTGPTSALLGMQRWDRTVNIEISSLKGIRGSDSLLRAIEQDAVNLGGLVHWGQMNNVTAEHVQRSYPAIEAWRSALALVSRNGRLNLFSTDFTWNRGLEVVQPRIYDFRVDARFVCAGASIGITWDAEDNPPNTRLELEFVDGLGRVALAYPLFPLRGQRSDLPMPAGEHELRLSAINEVSGLRGQTHSESVRVVGVGSRSSYRHLITGTPVCADFDGQPHWVVELALSSTDWSPHLIAGNLRLGPGSAGLMVVKDGQRLFLTPPPPGLVYVDVEFLERSAMLGRWLLVHYRPGCEGPPPTLSVLVQVRCG